MLGPTCVRVRLRIRTLACPQSGMSQVTPCRPRWLTGPLISYYDFSHKHHNYVSVFLSFTIMHSHSGCLFCVHFDSIAEWRGWWTDFCIVLFVSFHFFLFFHFQSNQRSFVFDHVYAQNFIMQTVWCGRAVVTYIKTNWEMNTTRDGDWRINNSLTPQWNGKMVTAAVCSVFNESRLESKHPSCACYGHDLRILNTSDCIRLFDFVR